MDLTIGPDDEDYVVHLPDGMRFGPFELRPTICEVKSTGITRLRSVMNDPINWVGLFSQFHYEKALSDYIAAYPHRLDDGLTPYPSKAVRERVFRGDNTRLDVLLLVRRGTPVIVGCKQRSPTVDNIKQLRHYMRLLMKETGKNVRGFVVHGGARQLRPEVRGLLKSMPNIDVLQYRLEVDFAPST